MSSYYDYDSGAIVGAIIAGFFIVLLIALIPYVLSSIFLMKIFEKAGVEGKWRAWVPIYNVMIFFKLGDLSPWLVLYGIGAAFVLGILSLIPILGILFAIVSWVPSVALAVLSVLAAWRVGLKLQKDAVWVVLYIFLAIVWEGILAFDKSRWNANIPGAPWAAQKFLVDTTVWAGIPSQPKNPPAAAAYGAAPGYGAAPQGYAPPAQPGYAPPAQPGYAPPAQPGYGQPAQPAYPQTAQPGYPAAAPAAPPVPPAEPPAPATPPAPPTTPPTAPPTEPPAAPPAPEQPTTDTKDSDEPPAPPANPNPSAS